MAYSLLSRINFQNSRRGKKRKIIVGGLKVKCGSVILSNYDNLGREHRLFFLLEKYVFEPLVILNTAFVIK